MFIIVLDLLASLFMALNKYAAGTLLADFKV
jgi:hypothetical protein